MNVSAAIYMPTDSSGDATVGTPGGQEGLGTIMQDYTEQSNVSVGRVH
jgi:flagellar basal-body rod protein FlgG